MKYKYIFSSNRERSFSFFFIFFIKTVFCIVLFRVEGKGRIESTCRQAHTRQANKEIKNAKGKSGRKCKKRRKHEFCYFSFLFCCCCGGREREREMEGRRMGIDK